MTFCPSFFRRQAFWATLLVLLLGILPAVTLRTIRESGFSMPLMIIFVTMSWVLLGVPGRLRAFDRPTLMFLAMGDAWAPSEACAPLREVSRAKVRFISFSRFTHGDDFAHVTLLRGVNAARFVFGPIEEFLR